MRSPFDRFMPRVGLQFPDASVLTIGTITCEDQIHQAVYLAYTRSGSSTPTLELELPPTSIEVMIRHLQEYANQARFVNGQRMLEYPEPYPAPRPGALPARRKAGRRKASRGKPDAPPKDGPAAAPGDSGATEGPPPVG